MKPEIIAFIGVAVGALIAGGLGWLSSYTTSRREEQADRRKINVELCTQFLTTIDADIQSLTEYEEQHGEMPGDRGLYFAPKARHDLTALELQCPPKVFQAAERLLKALWAWADGPDDGTKLFAARGIFIRTAQTRL